MKVIKVKIFLDTANLKQIRKVYEYGIIDGVTTNPTLISREKNVEFYAHLKKYVIW